MNETKTNKQTKQNKKDIVKNHVIDLFESGAPSISFELEWNKWKKIQKSSKYSRRVLQKKSAVFSR